MFPAPSLFVSHGSPMFALEPGELGPRLRRLGGLLHNLRAVVVVSPHWQTRGVRVMATATPSTIHDFGGFPPALYELQYAPPGSPALAADIAQLLATAGYDTTIDDRRGLDHGAWVPLRHLLPAAEVPVLQVSMPFDLDTRGAYHLGAALAPLRERGVTVIGSGSLTHNLYEFRQHVRDPEYAAMFSSWVNDAVSAGDAQALIDYRRLAPHATRAHPTEEHYLPLLVALGAAGHTDIGQRIPGGISDGVLSMDSFGWGLPEQALQALPPRMETA